ncbi:hypothetical protein [Myceligenerans salitolerans]|uniref:hypothetical protein n=1 Tax=Myceligenerans salitolerans TaxID=1230528 RepID=UPI001F5EAF45|nr:hypothetical protein [Myceligenerans salitolerans]
MSHEDATHGPAPLGPVDPEPLHRAVDALAATLHDYVRTAVGVRAEFGAAEADEDPRVHALEEKVGQRNADLFDTLHAALGMHPDLTTSIWEPGADGAGRPDEAGAQQRAEAFYLSFLVAARGADASLDGVLGLVDATGEDIAERLADGGYEVLEWISSRGAPAGFDDGPLAEDLFDGTDDELGDAGFDDDSGPGRDDFREDDR